MERNRQKIYCDFERLVRTYQTALKTYIRRLGVANSAVEDIAHDVLIVAYQQWHKFDSTRDVKFWLYGIARNCVRNELRKHHRHHRILNDKLTLYLIEQVNEPAAEGDENTNEYAEDLNLCIAKLSDKHRQLLQAKYIDDGASAQLADTFNMSATAVRLVLMRLRKKLRNCIESGGPR